MTRRGSARPVAILVFGLLLGGWGDGERCASAAQVLLAHLPSAPVENPARLAEVVESYRKEHDTELGRELGVAALDRRDRARSRG